MKPPQCFRSQELSSLPLLAFCVFIAGCDCLSRPTSDSTPPSAVLVVEWVDTNNRRQSQTFTPNDSPMTIRAREKTPVSVMYLGADNEGMRKVKLDYSLATWTGAHWQEGLLAAIEVNSSCPHKSLTGAHNFEGGGWTRYKFTTRSDNWLGATTNSAQVKVLTTPPGVE